jgi:hypothetical protein
VPIYRNLAFGVQTQTVTTLPTSATVTFATNPATGDTVVVTLAIRQTAAAVPAITPPAGWTTVGNVGGSAANTGHIAMYLRRWTTGDATTWVWTFGAAVSGFSTTTTAYGGVDAATPQDVAAGTFDSGATAGLTLSIAATPVTPWTNHVAAWACYSANPITGGDGVRLCHALGNADVQSVAHGRRQATATFTATATSTSVAWRVGILLVLRPADAGAVAPGRSFFVRPDGSDTNTGLGATAGEALASLGRALGLSAALASADASSPLLGGDTLTVAPGVYRELVVAGFAALSEVRVLADGAAQFFPDVQPGEVRWSGWIPDDATTAPDVTNPLLDLNGRHYLTLDGFVLHATGASIGGVDARSVVGSRNLTVRGCTIATSRLLGTAISGTLPPDANSGWLLERNVFLLGPNATAIDLLLPLTAVAEYDAGFVIQNNVLLGGGGTSFGVSINGTGAGAFRGGGGVVRHNTIAGFDTGVRLNTTPTSSLFPTLVLRNLIAGSGTAVEGPSAALQMNLVADYNVRNAATASTVPGGGDPAVIPNLPLAYGSAPLQRRQARPMGEPGPGAGFTAFSRVQLQAKCGATGTDVGGANTAWTNPANVALSDDVLAVATAIAVTSGVTNPLRAVGFGLAVPAGATILGVRADVEGHASAASSVDVFRCQLVLGGAVLGTAKSATTKFSSTSTYQAFGSGTDLWGATPSVANVNDAGFGVEFVFRNVNAAVRTMNVDAIRLVVYYAHDASDQPTIDLYGRPRPGPYGVPSAAGAVERGDVGVRDGLTYRSASPSVRLDGFGTHDWLIPVDTAPQAISCYLRKSSTYTGTQPRLQLLADPEIGVTAQETLMTVGADTWEQVALTFTPTEPGLATVRVFSPCTAAAGAVWVDDFDV